MSKKVSLGVIGGDGIGPEVTKLALQAIDLSVRGSGIEFVTTEYDFGAKRYLATGEVLTEADLEALSQHDAICWVQSVTRVFHPESLKEDYF